MNFCYCNLIFLHIYDRWFFIEKKNYYEYKQTFFTLFCFIFLHILQNQPLMFALYDHSLYVLSGMNKQSTIAIRDLFEQKRRILKVNYKENDNTILKRSKYFNHRTETICGFCIIFLSKKQPQNFWQIEVFLISIQNKL